MNARRALEEVVRKPAASVPGAAPAGGGPTVMQMSAKCSDLFYAAFVDASGRKLGEYDGYVPDFMPGEHYGDYVELDIDLATGRILNWKAPSKAQIAAIMTPPKEG